MNISGISGVMPGSNLTNVNMAASMKVLDMAQDVFEDVAAELIDAMSSVITGLGQNIDTYA